MPSQIIDLSTLRHKIGFRVASVTRFVTSTPEVDALLDSDSVVAIGVSGGKDSVACALAVARHLDLIGHTGPRVLVHADLGRVEWKDSAPACDRLAARVSSPSTRAIDEVAAALPRQIELAF
ncbi:hypothetical protein [Paraburkholderia sp. BL10I2N1]|uniref:hypothetical protein n=1 Tax=Paraburkholderia sp. BL10I2N1 TaxID=1938796 RepID=UPI001FB6BC49|nr:hypothetical protein [Paraburkholderia sp. BL10I2N1]